MLVGVQATNRAKTNLHGSTHTSAGDCDTAEQRKLSATLTIVIGIGRGRECRAAVEDQCIREVDW
jgi:hypothetical protein